MPGDPEVPGFKEPQLPTPPQRGFPIFGRPAKVIAVVLACGLLFYLLGLGRYVFWRGLEMTLTEPAVDPDGKQIRAKFRFDVIDYGFPSAGAGGACMVAELAPLIKADIAADKGVVATCNVQDDCNPKYVKGLPPGTPNPQKWYGYCLPNEQNQKRCYYKPTDGPTQDDHQLCQKSLYKGGAAWPIGVDHDVPATPGFDLANFYSTYTKGKPAKWRTVGLMIGTKPNTQVSPDTDPVCVGPGTCVD